MFLTIILFVIGLGLLIKGGDWFVDGAVGIANRFHMPKLLVGATIVSIGTTLPEVMVSSMSAIEGHSQVAYGNAIGSIICNTALISAISIIVLPQIVKRSNIAIPSLFFLIASIIYVIVSYTTGYFSRTIGIILLIIFVIYVIVAVVLALKSKDEPDNDEVVGFKTLWMNVLMIIVGAIMIAVGSKLLIDNGTKIASSMGVPESVIALTMIALGTSLPELITAIQSIRKKEGNLSLGNIIGANLFNIVLVCGMSITLKPFSVPSASKLFGYNQSLILEIPLMMLVMCILIIPSIIKQKTYRFQGIILFLLYIGFLIIQFAF